MSIDTPILTRDFVKAAYTTIKMSSWAGRQWDEKINEITEVANKQGLSTDACEIMLAQNRKTESGREGVAGLIWYVMNKNAYPTQDTAQRAIMDTCLHLFALRLADNWVDEGDKDHTSLERLLALRNQNDMDGNPLARASIYLLDKCRYQFQDRVGYIGVCNRLLKLVTAIEEHKDSAPTEQLEALDKEVCFMTVLPVAFLTARFSGKPKRNPAIALRSMLYSARTMDYLGDFKKDYQQKTFNGLLVRARKEVGKNDCYKALRNEVNKTVPHISRSVIQEMRRSSRLLEPTASGMYSFASLLMYSKYLTEYRLFTNGNAELSLRVAKRFIRSF